MIDFRRVDSLKTHQNYMMWFRSQSERVQAAICAEMVEYLNEFKSKEIKPPQAEKSVPKRLRRKRIRR